MEEPPCKVGSDAWNCGDAYEDEYKVRIAYVVRTLNKEALCDHLSRLRGNVGCSLYDGFSVGSFNLVIKATFEDAVQWIVRLRMPPIEEFESSNDHDAKIQGLEVRSSLDKSRYEMQSELDTMEFVRLNTDIPVPQVHNYNLARDNAVGFPFAVMDYVHGTTAEELSHSLPGDHEGIPPKFRTKLWRQIASIMVKLANVRFSQSGSIIRSDTGHFQIGKFVDTGSGPYASTGDFLKYYPLALEKSIYQIVDGDLGQENLLQALDALRTTSESPLDGSNQTFGLANYDLGPNNVIVDSEFNVLSVIDWDTVFAVPDPALYRFPFLMGVAAPLPGTQESRPRVLQREHLGRAFAQVVEEVSQVERSRGVVSKQHEFFGFSQSGFFTKEANIYRSLIFLRFKQSFVNEDWTKALEWLQKH